MKKMFFFLLLLSLIVQLKGQVISMEFPKFAGKSYDFVIFQGSRQETIYQGIIPDGGKFSLEIPKDYGSYTGMSRWLITGTKEGGGLDMFIPGHDFSVVCYDEIPNKDNIVFVNNKDNSRLNSLYKTQEEILSRYKSMKLAMQSYGPSSPHFTFFKSERDKQMEAYILFEEKVKKNNDYISHLLYIINITHGKASTLSNSEIEVGRNVSNYIHLNLDWNALYTSGHWKKVIESWLSIHIYLLKDLSQFLKEFEHINSNFHDGKLNQDFCDIVIHYLNYQNQRKYIESITPIIRNSSIGIHENISK